MKGALILRKQTNHLRKFYINKDYGNASDPNINQHPDEIIVYTNSICLCFPFTPTLSPSDINSNGKRTLFKKQFSLRCLLSSWMQSAFYYLICIQIYTANICIFNCFIAIVMQEIYVKWLVWFTNFAFVIFVGNKIALQVDSSIYKYFYFEQYVWHKISLHRF